jgi:hypothetical protein
MNLCLRIEHERGQLAATRFDRAIEEGSRRAAQDVTKQDGHAQP